MSEPEVWVCPLGRPCEGPEGCQAAAEINLTWQARRLLDALTAKGVRVTARNPVVRAELNDAAFALDKALDIVDRWWHGDAEEEHE